MTREKAAKLMRLIKACSRHSREEGRFEMIDHPASADRQRREAAKADAALAEASRLIWEDVYETVSGVQG